MDSRIEDMGRQYPGMNAAEPFAKDTSAAEITISSCATNQKPRETSWPSVRQDYSSA